jgi:antitoxin ParD1/3/4
MAKMTISMPDAMSAYVATRVEEGQYGNVSEFFRDLVRRDQQRRYADAHLRELIEEGEASGVDERTVEDIWAEVEAEVRQSGRRG